MKKPEVNKIKAIVYLPLKPEVAKRLNLPLKLPILAEDLVLITDQNNIPLDVILRGLEEQYSLEKITIGSPIWCIFTTKDSNSF